MRGGTESPSIWETERQPYGECLGGPRAPQGESGCPRDSVELPTLPPLGSKPLPALPPLHCQPVVVTAAALPGCFIYLFCTNRVAADSFSPGLKEREEKKKKRRNALWLFSLPRSWQQAAAAAIAAAPGRRAGGQAGRRGVRHTGRCGPRGSLNGTGPQPWTDAVPNLMPPSGFSGKCPHLLSWSCSCPSL